MKRFLATALILVLMVTTLVSAPFSAALAESYPAFSSSAYCEFVARSTIPVYREPGLSTRGTCSPGKSYNAYVDPADVCWILAVSGNALQISYPTPSGRRIGYVARSYVLPSAPLEKKAVYNQYNTLKTPGGAVYGYVENGDTAWNCGKADGKIAVIYTAQSGSRAYKIGWMTASDYAAATTGKQPVPSGYNAAAAVAYANKWSRQGQVCYNPDYTFYSGADCANFVSQCLTAGGIPWDAAWHPYTPYRADGDSDTAAWKTSTGLRNYLIRNRKCSHKENPSSVSDIHKGDILFVQGNDGVTYGHVVIVKSVTNGRIYICGHTKYRNGQEYSLSMIQSVVYPR